MTEISRAKGMSDTHIMKKGHGERRGPVPAARQSQRKWEQPSGSVTPAGISRGWNEILREKHSVALVHISF